MKQYLLHGEPHGSLLLLVLTNAGAKALLFDLVCVLTGEARIWR